MNGVTCLQLNGAVWGHEVTANAMKHSGPDLLQQTGFVWFIIVHYNHESSPAWHNNIFVAPISLKLKVFHVFCLHICENDMTLFTPTTYGVCMYIIMLCFFSVCLAVTVAMMAKPVAYVSLRISDSELSHMYCMCHMLWMCRLIHVKFECILYNSKHFYVVTIQCPTR